MRKLNKKGFTLIEIIAVIIILIILSSTAVIAITSSLKKSKENYCVSQQDMLTLAGRDYFNDNTSKLPLNILSSSCVYLDTLITNNYINPLTDYDKNKCNTLTSKVCAIKATEKDYYYTSSLDCNKCNTTSTNSNKEETTPSISFSPSTSNTTNKDLTVTINITDKNNIISYRYEVYEKGVSVPIESKEALYNSKKKIQIKFNRKGTYYIKAYATNDVLKEGYKKSNDYVLNYTLDCNNSNIFDSSFPTDTWKNGELNVKIKKLGSAEAYDLEVSKDNGVTYTNILNNSGTNSYTYKTFTSGNYKFKVTYYDDQGSKCSVTSKSYKLDNNPPSCTSSGGNSNWTNASKVTLTGTCSDNESGCKTNAVKEITTDMNSTTVSPGTVYDNAGNSTVCPSNQTVKRDTVKPSCSINLSGTEGTSPYYKTEVTATLTKSDSLSGIDKYGLYKTTSSSHDVGYNSKTSVSQTSNTNTSTYVFGFVKDKAGNTKSCKITTSFNTHYFKVDKSPPTCELEFTGTYDSNNGWYKSASVKISFKKANDEGSGVKKCMIGSEEKNCTSASVTRTSDTESKKYTAKVYDKAGNVTSCNKILHKDSKSPVIVSKSYSHSGAYCHGNDFSGEKTLQAGKTASFKVTYKTRITDSTSGVGTIRYILAPTAWVNRSAATIHWDHVSTAEATNLIYNGDGGGSKDTTKTGYVQIHIGPYSTNVNYCFDYSANIQALDKAGNWAY